MIASIMPNMAYVVDHPKKGVTTKAGRRGLLNLAGEGFGGTPVVGDRYVREEKRQTGRITKEEGGGSYPVGQPMFDYGDKLDRRTPYQHDDTIGCSGGYSWLSEGEYHSKALSVVKPHEDLEPLENDHHLRSLLENPNPYDTFYDVSYELEMFYQLMGVWYLWAIPNNWGLPAELWALPSHWVWPRTGGGKYLQPMDTMKYEHADEFIQYYEVRPWGGMGSAGILRIPPNEVIMHRRKSPLNKIDGYADAAAIANWIDLEESISRSQWSQMINVARPELFIKLGQGYDDPDDDRLQRWLSKVMAEHGGEYNYGKPWVLPSGADAQQISWPPNSMAYEGSGDQARDKILATKRVPKAALGLSEEMTYGSVLATLMGFCNHNLNLRFRAIGQTLTKYLGKQWDERSPAFSQRSGTGGGQGTRKVRIWYDDCSPADPDQVNADIAQDINAMAISPNEIRALRGRKPWRYGGDDPWYQGAPVPVNTKQDFTWLAKLTTPMTEATGQMPARAERPGGTDGQSGGSNLGGVAGNGEGQDGGTTGATGSPGGENRSSSNRIGIAEPNGPPQKEVVKSDDELVRLANAYLKAKAGTNGHAGIHTAR